MNKGSMVRTLVLLTTTLLLGGCPSDPEFVVEDTNVAETTAGDTTETETAEDTEVTTETQVATDTRFDPEDTLTEETTVATDSAVDSMIDTATDSAVFETHDEADPDVELSEACGPGQTGTACACVRDDCTAPVDGPTAVDAAMVVRNGVRPVIAVARPQGVHDVDVVDFGPPWSTQSDAFNQFGTRLEAVSIQGYFVVLHHDFNGKLALAWQNTSSTYDLMPVANVCSGAASVAVDPTGDQKVVVMCRNGSSELRWYESPNLDTPLGQRDGSPLSVARPSTNLVTAMDIDTNGRLTVLVADPATGSDWNVDVLERDSVWSSTSIGVISAPPGAERLAVAYTTDTNRRQHAFIVREAAAGGPELVHFYDNGPSNWSNEIIPGTVTAETRLDVERTRDVVLHLLKADVDRLAFHTILTHETNAEVAVLVPVNAVLRADLVVEDDKPWVMMVGANQLVRLWRPPLP